MSRQRGVTFGNIITKLIFNFTAPTEAQSTEPLWIILPVVIILVVIILASLGVLVYKKQRKSPSEPVDFVDDNPMYGMSSEYGNVAASQIVDHNEYYFAEDEPADYQETSIVDYNDGYGRVGDEN